jgi:hypothetical protein
MMKKICEQDVRNWTGLRIPNMSHEKNGPVLMLAL